MLLLASSLMSDLYAQGFFDRIVPGASTSARAILPMLFDRFSPTSVVDVGCGTGAWLSVAQELGVVDLLGIDGPWVAAESVMIGSEHFLECDLGNVDPSIDRRFEMCLSTEVAEHLPPQRSAGFVDLLCRLSDVVVFSAAIPRQGGMGHVNERWQSFWVGQFERNGFGVLDPVRPAVWNDDNVEPWYRQNLLVFVKGAAADARMIDVVHPYFAERGLSVPSHPLVVRARQLLKKVRNTGRGLVARVRR